MRMGGKSCFTLFHESDELFNPCDSDGEILTLRPHSNRPPPPVRQRDEANGDRNVFIRAPMETIQTQKTRRSKRQRSWIYPVPLSVSGLSVSFSIVNHVHVIASKHWQRRTLCDTPRHFTTSQHFATRRHLCCRSSTTVPVGLFLLSSLILFVTSGHFLQHQFDLQTWDRQRHGCRNVRDA